MAEDYLNPDDDWVMKVEGVSKKFTMSLQRSMAYGLHDVLRSMFGLPTHKEKLRISEFWSLKDVSFTLKRGESLGLVGRNGAGKSTFLRILNSIYPPTTGSIEIKGRIGGLIAVGAGFHPHMSGYENIFVNGTLLGMTRKEIEQKLDEIIAFAEIGEFIHSPVSTYSSGMSVRLGFAIAVHADMDILLADEVLAVGDVGFRTKSLAKIMELKKQGVSIIFVSHIAAQVEQICDRAILFNGPKAPFYGSATEVMQRYEEVIAEDERKKAPIKEEVTETKETVPASPITITEVLFKKDEAVYDINDTLTFTVKYKVKHLTTQHALSFWLTNGTTKIATAWDVDDNPLLYTHRETGSYQCTVTVPLSCLKPLNYALFMGVQVANEATVLEEKKIKIFEVQDLHGAYKNQARTSRGGLVHLPITAISEKM